MRKRVVFIADSLDNAYKFQQVLSRFDVEIAAGSTVQVKKLLAPGAACDLVIFEARGAAASNMGEIGSLAEDRACPLIVIVDEADAILRTSSEGLLFFSDERMTTEKGAVNSLLDELKMPVIWTAAVFM